MVVLLLLLCCCSILILGGGYYYVYGLPEGEGEPDAEPDDTELKSIQDTAFEREMGKIITEMKEEVSDVGESSQKVAVAQQALERAKFDSLNVGDAFKTVNESSKKLAEAKAQILVYQGFVDTATYDDEKAIWQQAVDETQKKIDYFQTTYNEAKKAADDAATALRNKQAAEKKAAEAAKERAKQAEEARAAQREAQRKAKELETLKDGCKKVTWEGVVVGQNPGFFQHTALDTRGQTVEKGLTRITSQPGSGKTSVNRKEITGRDRRGNPILSWKNKANYDGYIILRGKEVGWVAMNKKPSRQQPRTCKDGVALKTNCRYEPGDFTVLHTFSDDLLKFVHDGNLGVIQGKTGKFYSIPDKEVMDNPIGGNSDCKTKLDYK
jgi:hypothetical protein